MCWESRLAYAPIICMQNLLWVYLHILLWWNSWNSKEPKVCVQERMRKRKREKTERKQSFYYYFWKNDLPPKKNALLVGHRAGVPCCPVSFEIRQLVQSKGYYQSFFRILIELITKLSIWAWLSNHLIIRQRYLESWTWLLSPFMSRPNELFVNHTNQATEIFAWYRPISPVGPTNDRKNNTYPVEVLSTMWYVVKVGRWNKSALWQVHTSWFRERTGPQEKLQVFSSTGG